MRQDLAPRLDREARAEAILDVAQDIFLTEGFAAASMSQIAARLGGSKGTLYNYFRSKDELFEAFVRRRCFWQKEAIFGPIPEDGELADELTRIGRAYLKHILSETSLRVLRLIMAEAERWPEIGRVFYEAGPKQGVERLAAMMDGWAAEGRLRIEDPQGAAQMFMGLCKDRWFMVRLCQVAPELTDDQIAAQVDEAVAIFLRTYAA